MFTQVGDHDLWNDHSTNECQKKNCGGMTRAWKEGKNRDQRVETKPSQRTEQRLKRRGFEA